MPCSIRRSFQMCSGLLSRESSSTWDTRKRKDIWCFKDLLKCSDLPHLQEIMSHHWGSHPRYLQESLIERRSLLWCRTETFRGLLYRGPQYDTCLQKVVSLLYDELLLLKEWSITSLYMCLLWMPACQQSHLFEDQGLDLSQSLFLERGKRLRIVHMHN